MERYMEFYEVRLINTWYFKIKLPLPDLRKCKYKSEVLKYIYSIKRYVKATEDKYLYDEVESEGVFIFQVGYASFILNTFFEELSMDSIYKLESLIYLDLKLPDFPNLRDYQNQDIKQLAEYRRGLFQTYTSYGKSEVIATLANYLANTLGKTVLIVTSGKTSLDELWDRLKRLYGIELDYFDYESNLNLIQMNGFPRSSQYDKTSPFWQKEIYILADEVEYCCSDTHMEFYENMSNVKVMYGFSATADKKSAEPIYSRASDEFLQSIEPLKYNPFDRFSYRMEYTTKLTEEAERVREVLGRNKILVGYYGNTVVFKKPTEFNITLIDVVTSITKDDIEIPEEYDYNEIIYSLFTEDRICRLLEGIAFKSGLIFIPMFRLQIIDFWIDNYFKKPDYVVLVISGRGYELFENGEYIANINAEQMKQLVNNNMINVILGTRSSYSAIDLPELNRSILLYSKAANVVIQAIGRTARKGTFEVYNICPIKNIPTYSKDLLNRKSLIKNYYKDCNIIECKKLESIYV